MRVALISAVMLLGLSVMVTVARADETISCDGFVIPDSELSALIGTIRSGPQCERAKGPHGAYVEKYGVAGLAQAAGGEPFRMMVVILRFYGPEMPIGDPESLGENFEVLADTVAVSLPGIAGEGVISRFETPKLDGMTITCVEADTKNGAKSQTVIQICRAVAAPADNALIIETAGDIAARYMVGVVP